MFLVGSFKRVQCLGSYLLFGWRVGRELIHLFLDVVCYVVRASFGRSFFPGPYSSIWVHCTLWWPQNQYIYIYSTAEGCGGSFKKEIYGEVGCCESCTDGSNLLSLPLSICISLYLYLCQKVCQGPQKQKLRAENKKSHSPKYENNLLIHSRFHGVWGFRHDLGMSFLKQRFHGDLLSSLDPGMS